MNKFFLTWTLVLVHLGGIKCTMPAISNYVHFEVERVYAIHNSASS
jgi:hypothetical protein